MGRNGALLKKDRLRRIDAARNQRSRHFADVRAEILRIDVYCQRMGVGEEEEALSLVLHPNPSQDCAEQVAEMKPASRLDARNDAHRTISRHRCRASCV